jgi:poly-gamma-glutamate system protein
MYVTTRYRITLLSLAGCALVLFGGLRLWIANSNAAYTEGVRASETTLAAVRAIRDARGSVDVSDSPSNDPLQQAVVGPYNTPITTDAGSLRSKITATNPNFAATIIELLRAAGVGPGDIVAIAYTGSFPVLDLATIIATESLGAEPIIVSSVGASNWGATDPDFTILDMESVAMRAGLIHHRSLAAWEGGLFKGHRMAETGRQLTSAAMTRNGVPPLTATTLRSGVEERLRVYTEQAGDRPLKAFINVGGGQVSTGGQRYRQRFTPGLTAPGDALDQAGSGLLARMHAAGVPVIHLVDVIELARQHQLPVAPTQTPPVPDGAPYRDWQAIRIAAGAALVLLLALAVGARLLILTPAAGEGFDPYFGTAGGTLRRALGLRSA